MLKKIRLDSVINKSNTSFIAYGLLLSISLSQTPVTMAAEPGWHSLPELAGLTPGEFRVNETGSATYTIPINLPAGIAGLTPQLGLSYDSQGGNGHLGKGWKLGGLSAISRCRPTLDVEGRTNAEPTQFCLDGQKLILTGGQTYGGNGAEYRTEIDSFSKIISYGSQSGYPTHFRVWRKDGSISEYGNTADSRIEGSGSSVPVTWAINKIQDNLQRDANSILVSYLKDNAQGEFVPDKITYGGGQLTVQMQYSDQRPDKPFFYSAGYKSSLTKRLEAVQVKRNNNLYRRYILNYQTGERTQESLLVSIQECQQNSCFPETRLVWSQTEKSYKVAINSSIPIPSGFFFSSYKVTDLNGNGQADVVFAYEAYDHRHRQYRYKLVPYISDGGTYRQFGAVIDIGPIYYNPDFSYQFIDYNHDGYADLVVNRNLIYGGPNGFSKTHTLIPVSDTFYIADQNGDGLQDFIYVRKGTVERELRTLLTTRNTNQNATQPYIHGKTIIHSTNPNIQNNDDFVNVNKFIRTDSFDLNGDGRSDIYASNYYMWTGSRGQWYHYYSDRILASDDSEKGFYIYDNDPGGSSKLLDINGDGLPDKIKNNQLHINTGKGFKFYTNLNLPGGSSKFQYVDYTGNGALDLIYSYQGKLWMKPWLFNGFGDAIQLDDSLSPSAGSQFVDVNGNGLLDYITVQNNRISVQLAHEESTTSPRITEIIGGLGSTTNIAYAPLTDTSLYTKGTGAAWKLWGNCIDDNCMPVFDMSGPLYVVRSVSSSAPRSTPNGIDIQAKSQINYQYAEARSQGGGRGFLGFGRLMTTDVQTGIVTETVYRQDFPYTGFPEKTTVKTASGQLLSESTNQWDSKKNGLVHQPYLRQSVEKSYDLVTKALLKTITTTQTTDDFGNVVNIAVTSAGAGVSNTKTTVSQYSNDTGKWHLGRLLRSTVTTKQGGKTLDRSSAFEYSAITGLLTKEIIEPNDEKFRLTTTYVYDQWGNKTSSTVSGSGIPTRTSKTTFGSDGLYAISQTNALNQVTEQVLERDAFGRVLRVRDINGVESTISYDAMGRKVAERHASGAGKDFDYFTCANSPVSCPPSGALVTQITPLGGASAWEVQDVIGRTIRKVVTGFDGNKVFVDTQYDDLSRPVRISEPYYEGNPVYWNTTEYDILGRAIRVTNANGDSETVSYSGYDTLKTNAKGHRTTETRNALGQLVLVTDNLNNTIEYGYDLQGNLTRTLQSASDTSAQAETTIQYDRLGRKVSMDDADKGQWSYQYNVLGQLIQQTDAKGQKVEFTYDLLGRKLTRIDRRADNSIEGNTTWVYDDGTKGVLSEVSDSVSAFGQILSYDSYGRPTGAGTTFDGEMYVQSTTYDSFGRVLEKRDAAGASSGVRYLYNEHGYMNAIQDLKSSLEWYRVNSMDARGNTVVQTVGGLKTTRYYDPLTGFLESLVTGVAGSNIQDLGYDWDEVGNLTSRTDKSTGTTLVETFGYDGLNRVTSATVGSQSDQYRYNGLGNITSKTGVGSYTYGQNGAGIHAVTHTSIGNISYQYDANGNMTSGGGRTLVYSTFDKPTRIDKNGHTTQFQYDVNRSRYKRVDTDKNNDTTITRYVGNVEFITRPNGDKETKRYINGVAIDTTTTKSGGGTENSVQLLFKDHLGSIHTIMDGNTMTVLQRQSFDPFGQRRNPTNWEDLLDSQLSNFNTSFTTRGFTGHEQLDQVGLIHMNGRVYDPKLGRFLQADPFVQAVGNTQSFNRYSYVLNNPLNAVDPSGYLFKWVNKTAKRIGRSIIRGFTKVFGPEVVNAVGTFFAGWFGGAPGVAAWQYEFNRAMGASSSQAFRAAVVAGASYWAFNPKGASPGRWSQAAIQVSTNIIAAKDPEIGRVLAFAHSAWGLEPSKIAQQAVGEIAQYKAAKEVQRLANRNGLSLEELNLLLALNSKLGLEIAGSTFSETDRTVTGFASRKKHPLLGVMWDVNDTLLNAQGLLDAVSLQVAGSQNAKDLALTGHSLGAARVNNLYRQGWIDGATTLSLPGFAYPAAGSISVCGNADIICGGGLLTALRIDTLPVTNPSAGWKGLYHTIESVPGYKYLWYGELD